MEDKLLSKIIIRIRRSKLAVLLLRSFYYIFTKFPTRKKTIFFESFLGKQFSDNPKAIYLYIKEHYPDYQLFWSVDRRLRKKFDGYNLNILPRFSIKWIIYMARAEYWITNSRLPLWIPKPKGTTYVQTWHGTPLKKLAVDMEEVHMSGTNAEKYKRNFVKESSKWDYLISPNTYSTVIFKRAFKFNKKIIESGYPRNDILTNMNDDESIKKFKKQAGIPLNKKVILYAPTWRDNQFYSKGNYKFDVRNL